MPAGPGRPRESMTAKRRFLWNGVLAAAALALAVSLAEVAVRVFAPQPTGLTHQDRYGLVIHWPRLVRYLPAYGHSVSFNSQGMRDREHPIAKPAGVFRILILGDSFMEAYQVPFEESVPALLERQLGQRPGRRIEVISAGVGGWGTDDELRYLTSYGMKWRPDLILVAMTLHNDISDNLREEWHTIQGDTLVALTRQPFSTLRWQVIQLKAFLASRFQLYQIWRRVWHGAQIREGGRQLNAHVTDLFRADPNPPIVRGYALTRLLLARIQSVATEGGSQVVLMLLPLQMQLSEQAFGEFGRGTGVADSLVQDQPQRAMKAVAADLGISVLDLLPVFRNWIAAGGAPLFLEWDGHWNAAGHRVAAEAAGSFLETLRLTR